MVYFDKLRGTVVGEVYFRVSKHLSIPLSEVIKGKFTPDIRMLIGFYAREVKIEMQEHKKFKEELDDNKWRNTV